jgi:murein peptide amidase A
MLRRLSALLAALGLAASTSAVLPSATASYVASGGSAAPTATRPAVIGTRVLGHSVQGRAIRAWHLGEPGQQKVLLIATMHGNEPASRQILYRLRDGARIHGINLWVVPVYNPDGLAHHTRKNAHGVDLNRNYPFHWTDLGGTYESGPHARSEPETRAMMRFLKEFRPARIISFHQPLNAVDTHMKRPRWARRVADKLNLPTDSLDCGGVCHGTMTGWYNHRFRGAALTAEYGRHPSRYRMRVQAPRQVLSIFGAGR